MLLRAVVLLWCCCGSTVRDPVTRQREFHPEVRLE